MNNYYYALLVLLSGRVGSGLKNIFDSTRQKWKWLDFNPTRICLIRITRVMTRIFSNSHLIVMYQKYLFKLCFSFQTFFNPKLIVVLLLINKSFFCFRYQNFDFLNLKRSIKSILDIIVSLKLFNYEQLRHWTIRWVFASLCSGGRSLCTKSFLVKRSLSFSKTTRWRSCWFS